MFSSLWLRLLWDDTTDKTTKQGWSHENLNSLQGTMNQSRMPPCKSDLQPLMMRFHLSESINSLASESPMWGRMIVPFLFLYSNHSQRKLQSHIWCVWGLDTSCQFWGASWTTRKLPVSFQILSKLIARPNQLKIYTLCPIPPVPPSCSLHPFIHLSKNITRLQI